MRPFRTQRNWISSNGFAQTSAIAMSVYSYADEEAGTREIAIHFLDAGLYFGYRYGGEKTGQQREEGQNKRAEFSRQYRELTANLRERLDEGCGNGSVGSIGRSNELRTVYTMKVSTSPKFDWQRAQRSIDSGIPMIVWHRVSLERETAHNETLRSFLQNPALAKSPPGKKEMAEYPRRDAKGSPSHASVITGFNEARNEVIFTEPWGESARNRRMRVEEMEATAYAVFYFKW